jgi:predicted component of type VI protein secretion system
MTSNIQVSGKANNGIIFVVGGDSYDDFYTNLLAVNDSDEARTTSTVAQLRELVNVGGPVAQTPAQSFQQAEQVVAQSFPQAQPVQQQYQQPAQPQQFAPAQAAPAAPRSRPALPRARPPGRVQDRDHEVRSERRQDVARMDVPEREGQHLRSAVATGLTDAPRRRTLPEPDRPRAGVEPPRLGEARAPG